MKVIGKSFDWTLYWKDGKREVITGPDLDTAITNAGYGQGAMKALDFYGMGICNQYSYDRQRNDWRKVA